MKLIFRYLVLVLLAAGPLLSGCKKDEPATPATPTTGNLDGTVSPVGSITRVTAQRSDGLSFSVTPDATAGTFRFTDLPAGQYTLSFEMAKGFKPLPESKLSVVAGQTAAVGTLRVTSDGVIKSGTMSWSTGGQTYTATVVEGVIDRQNGQSGALYMKGVSTNGNQTDEISLRRNNGFSGVGNYTLTLAEYRRTTANVPTIYFDRTTINPLIISQYDEATGTVAGTFSFVGWTGDLGGSTIAVTNGTFSLKF